MQPSQLLTGALSTAFLLYITYSLWTLSQLFKVTSCNEAFDHCIPPILKDGDHLQVSLLDCCGTYMLGCKSYDDDNNSNYVDDDFFKDDMQPFFTKLMQKSFLAAYCNINPSV